MTSKRHVVEEGNTPGKPRNKRQTPINPSRRTLFPYESKKSCSNHAEWSEEECSALTQYICLFWSESHTDSWPMIKDPKFWDACASAVNKTCNSSRTGL
jgi:hypothetical protein